MMFFTKIIAQPNARCICRNFAKQIRRDKDPGINRRKQLLALNVDEITDFEDLETDFMQAHKSHRQHMQEMEAFTEKQKYLIVKQKYFKEKSPNFLTWHDKEQIRYLHRTDPEEWTIERLCEGFPALPEVIEKIVKSSWTKTKQHKITNHDASVQKNWKLFKEGQMPDLPKDLQEHLNKFTNRALNLKPFIIPESQKTVAVQKSNTTTEFLDIIKSYQKFSDAPDNNKQISANVVNDPPQTDTYLATPFSRRKSVTFNQLQSQVTEKIQIGKRINEEEKHIVMSIKPEEKEDKLIDLSQDKYQTSTGVQYFKKTERDLSHLNYPEKISIPKSIFKKGFIYKLNDCYYDDDGEFLYRVPGMG